MTSAEQEALLNRVLIIRRRLEHLVSRLRSAGFEFERPSRVFPGPEPGTEEAILRIEGTVGQLPLALKLFWKQIGSVDLTGSPPGWTEFTYLDQLIVEPPSAALYELDEFLDDKDGSPDDHYPYAVPIAPDIFHKADVSGGSPYVLAVPATSDDPELLNADGRRSFLEHVEHALRFAGFPGLEKCEGHDWPLARLLDHGN